MVSTEHFLAFGVAALVLIAIPGPSVVFVIGRALAYGRAVALATVLGNSLGLLAIVVLVAGGLGVVVQESIAVFTVLKLLGAAYLLYLGVQAIRHRRGFDVAGVGVPVAALSRVRALRQGFVVGVSNPKAFMIFAAVLPQFVDRQQGHVRGQMLVLACSRSGSAWSRTACGQCSRVSSASGSAPPRGAVGRWARSVASR